MSKIPCPLPEVQEALNAYIHDRGETLRIRQRIDQHLCAQFEGNDDNSTHLTKSIPSSTADFNGISPSITGVRKSYAKALQAHAAARSGLEELRSELDELKQGSKQIDHKPASAKKTGSLEEYVELLRVRQRQRRLEVIRQYFESLTSEANDMRLGIRDAVKQAIGDHPEAPAPMASSGSNDADIDELTWKLKKAVLVAKHNMDQAVNASANHRDRETAPQDLRERVHALRRARDELISWIEEQLAKVPEDPSADEIHSTELEANGSASRNITFADIEEQYKNYTASRESLLRFIQSTDKASTTLLSPASPTKRTFLSLHSSKPSMHSPTNAAKESSQAVTLLPYISALRDTSQTSQALLSQSAFLRRQLTRVEGDRKATLERLAQESHLLPAGAQAKALSWNQAANEAGKDLREFVEEKISVGEKALDQGQSALDDFSEETKALQSLQGL